MPTYIAHKYKVTDEESEARGYEYEYIGETWEDVEAAMERGDLGVGDKIFSCEEVGEVEGKLKTKNKG